MQILNRTKCLLASLLGLLLLPAVWADQVQLKNGDRVTGSIVKKDGNKLTIKTENLGTIVTPWDQVQSISTEKPLNIVLQDGRAFKGTLTLAAGKAEVAEPSNRVNIGSEDIAAIRNDEEEKAYQRLLHPGWDELWTGTGTIGFAGTAGNARTLTFTTGLKADRVTKTDNTSLYFSLIKASARIDNESKDTAQAVRGGISYGHNANTRIFFSVFNDYEYDRFQDLDLRFVIGGGIGLHAWKTDRSRMDLVAGGAYSRASFSTPLIRNSGELYWGNDYSLKINSTTSLIQSYRMFNDMSQTGNYRVNFDIGVNTKIFKWLTWNVSLSDRYLSDPVPGRKTNDFLYTTGIGITFAR